ncbi:MAG: cytochrome b [Burkholderiaceae bacterium]
MTNAADARYDRVAMLLHWAIGLGLLAQMVFGFLLDDLAPRGTPARGAVINLHKSTGLVLLALVAVRLAWRLGHRPPAWPASMSRGAQRAATWGHRALYATMLGLPVAGYVASNFSQHGVKFFGVALAPWGPNLPAVYGFFNGLHVTLAWVLAVLVAGHVLVALRHALLQRDGVFQRMWPAGGGASAAVLAGVVGAAALAGAGPVRAAPSPTCPTRARARSA